MSALAKTAVVLFPTNSLSASEFHLSREELVVRRMKLTLTGQGGQTNSIGAAALGFSLLVGCSSLFDKQNNLSYPATIDPVANTIVLGNGAPTDVTSNAAHITVWGALAI